MSFNIVLENSKAVKNKIDKNPTTLATLSGTLKQGTSIIDPVFIIEYSDMTDIKELNYCTISEFGRSYFINDIISVSNGLWELHCHVDVLKSFAEEIKARSGVIERQQNTYNLLLDDGTFKTYQNPKVSTIPFPNAFSNFSYVLAVAGGGN